MNPLGLLVGPYGPLIKVGAGVLVVGGLVGALYLSGAHHQSKKDAPKIQAAQAQAVVATGKADLSGSQLQNTNTRTAYEAKVLNRTKAYTDNVEAAQDDDTAYREYLDGLHDGGLRDDASSAPQHLGGVPGGSGPKGAPPAAGGSAQR